MVEGCGGTRSPGSHAAQLCVPHPLATSARAEPPTRRVPPMPRGHSLEAIALQRSLQHVQHVQHVQLSACAAHLLFLILHLLGV